MIVMTVASVVVAALVFVVGASITGAVVLAVSVVGVVVAVPIAGVEEASVMVMPVDGVVLVEPPSAVDCERTRESRLWTSSLVRHWSSTHIFSLARNVFAKRSPIPLPALANQLVSSAVVEAKDIDEPLALEMAPLSSIDRKSVV